MPPEPSPEAMRSRSGFRGSSESGALSTLVRGGASREATVLPLVLDEDWIAS